MSICFISNKDLTVTYSDIARRLRQYGEEIVWLCPSRRWANWLLAEGWPQNDILCLADYAEEWHGLPLDEAVAALTGIEGDAPATISNVIQMCRNLRRYPARFSYAYLAVVRGHVESFLLERKAEVVFGEGTWGFELLTYLVCRRHGIPMLTPSSTRIPDDRFYFGDAMTTEMFVVAEPTNDDLQWAENFLRNWLDRPIQPNYMRAQRGYKPFRARWINELLIGLLQPHLDRGDGTLWPLSARIADRTRRLVNSVSTSISRPFDKAPEAERYVLFPLHQQPENSIDVYGSLNSNQMTVIEAASRLIPATHRLWVKEHRSGLGDRSMGWYRRVLALPNVRLIDPFADIFPLIRNADAVVTIAGTAGYEAALLGVPSLGLAPMFFAPLLTNKPAARSHPLEWHFAQTLAMPKAAVDPARPDLRAVSFLGLLRANSYAGNPFELEVPKERRAGPDHLADEATAFANFVAGLRKKFQGAEAGRC